ncbi:MAG: hypothetical protein JXQ83_14755 [Candidatus Glassbacteria bacterium]|nr:hypothetical protein [Candidatus Glassbacteria bacterium]
MPEKIEVKAHAITEYRYGNFLSAFDGWTFRRFREDPRALNDWIAFTTVLYCPEDGLVHCGLTRFNNDILHVFNPADESFRSLGYNSVAEAYEVKVHRSLVMHEDGYIYGATALLHDIDEATLAPGGKLFRYRPWGEGQIEVLGVPVPHAYIQSLALDRRRGILYGFTFTPERMFRFDIATGQARDLGLIGSGLFIGQAHRPCVDDQGVVWGTWGSYYSRGSLPTEGRRVCLLSYDPDKDELKFHQYGLEGEGVSSAEMADEAVNGGDGYLYLGTRSGALYRLDPRLARPVFLGKPGFYLERLGGIVATSDGRMYLAAGDRDGARVYRYHMNRGEFDDLGPVFDPQRGVSAEKIHCLTMDEKRNILYGGEIDNVRRSSYLWSMRLG